MSHEHQFHRCDCRHERVKYCAKCQVCYCPDCNQEWRSYPSYTYTYGGWYGYPQGTVLCGQTTSGVSSSGSISGSMCNSAAVTPTNCTHAG